MKRTHYCGELKAKDIGAEVNLYGWVHSRRDHGGVIFIDLRDREGLVQAVFSPEQKELFGRAESLRSEFVINIKGKIRRRPEGTENPNLPTGEIEVASESLEILNASKVPPFEISDFIQASEDLRLKYRYLDLRRTKIRNNLILRNEAVKALRKYLQSNKFLEIETPFLTKSTPEGARDFLVPARLNPGAFYALPQSPQLFKQILMVSGFDRYFQVVRCFRDEDLRSDRQLEFTQLDMELSFIDEDEIHAIIEEMLKEVFAAAGISIEIPFPRMRYSESMLKYGSDKPDLRYGLEIHDITELAKGVKFKVFSETAAKGGAVRGIKLGNAKDLSRQGLDNLTEFVKTYGAKGLAWIKITDSGFDSPIAKFFQDAELASIREAFSAAAGDILFFVADTPETAAVSLGALRVHLAEKMGLVKKDSKEFKFTWIVDFPLFEWSSEEKRLVSRHHPFTSPRESDIPMLETSPEKVLARAYDLVLNGNELGGGSIRIHRTDLQRRIFKALKISDKETQDRFGFLLEALEYGAPPHGGIALGIDRMIAMMIGETSIREVIAFPKTQKGLCLMTGAPDAVTEKQLNELQIRVIDAPQAENKK
jgi:aspartyl-tRNA synthetase